MSGKAGTRSGQVCASGRRAPLRMLALAAVRLSTIIGSVPAAMSVTICAPPR